jgi:hypothetical protein
MSTETWFFEHSTANDLYQLFAGCKRPVSLPVPSKDLSSLGFNAACPTLGSDAAITVSFPPNGEMSLCADRRADPSAKPGTCVFWNMVGRRSRKFSMLARHWLKLTSRSEGCGR